MKKFIDLIIWPIFFGLGQFTIIIIFTIIFNLKFKFDNMIQYKEELNKFILDNKILIVLINIIIFLPIFIKLYQKYKNNYSKPLKDIYKFIIIGILYSLIFNLLFFIISKYINIDYYINNKLNINILLINIITNVLLGPIVEEYLFRGIIYNKAKIYFNKHYYLITSLIFSLMHNSFSTMIYTFIFSFILIYYYEKYQNIKAPIIIHSITNLCTLVLLPLIISLNFKIIIVILILTILFSLFLIKYEYKNK